MNERLHQIAAFHFVRLPSWLPKRLARREASALATRINQRGLLDPPWWSASFVWPCGTLGSLHSPDDDHAGNFAALERVQCGVAVESSDSPNAFTFAVGLMTPARYLRRRAASVLGIVSAILPARVENEELGDALEGIEARIVAGCPRHEILLKIYATVFWLLWHTVLYAVKGVTDALGRKGG